ncbi:MAG: DUF2282 domain-containing protein [Paludibacterium sp.]|uniref:BufA1 family periplasmic bufferin-type metallophore n=1 Tax=Paludibacterium sp. TaxID=1917523 RepID=UPI0025DCE15A|nr:DUF2282 domain-containing protein [Paludibacterium sp.]MBV8048931.1 DUF2282 domain-containing protein [Paludibacterium sp.]MBV8647795.1 DUF2282 domain-containing protein [Paludibacterium sp.]
MQHAQKTIQAAALGLLVLGLSAAATAASTEQCYGIAKAGKNDCASQYSKHSCAGQSKVDNDPNDFKLVPSGSCQSMGGKLKPAGGQ